MPSPNQDDRGGAAIDMLVLHYTGMITAEAALSRLCDPAAKVSAHYTIDEDGTIYAHVPEARRAWHAGVSFWAGKRNVNARSIGIELVNPGHEFGYRAFPRSQIAALIDLCRDILARHPIPAARVLGHSDVAPARKEDPGELFPWAQLAEAGIGLWPQPAQRSPMPWRTSATIPMRRKTRSSPPSSAISARENSTESGTKNAPPAGRPAGAFARARTIIRHEPDGRGRYRRPNGRRARLSRNPTLPRVTRCMKKAPWSCAALFRRIHRPLAGRIHRALWRP